MYDGHHDGTSLGHRPEVSVSKILISCQSRKCFRRLPEAAAHVLYCDAWDDQPSTVPRSVYDAVTAVCAV